MARYVYFAVFSQIIDSKEDLLLEFSYSFRILKGLQQEARRVIDGVLITNDENFSNNTMLVNNIDTDILNFRKQIALNVDHLELFQFLEVPVSRRYLIRFAHRNYSSDHIRYFEYTLI